jgi:type 1 glutamine amidotransferase
VKNAVTVRLNGELVLDRYECKFASSTGPQRLQAHGTPLWFKNIYIKELPSGGAAPMPNSAGKSASAKGKRVVLLAGGASHGRGEHAWPDGARLLKHCLDTSANVKGLTSEVHLNGWPTAPEVLDDAATIVLLSDGGGGHPLFNEKAREEKINALMARGVGLVCIHYAVEPPKQGEEPLLRWIGGFYKPGYSTNPINDVELLPATPDHPIARGLKPFKMRDEVYYRIWFGGGEGTGSAVPIAKIRLAHEPKPQVVAWAIERKDGGRGFGFTGCHFHKNWGLEGFRGLVLNAIVWTAKLDVPKDGVQSSVPSEMLEESSKK